MRRVRGQSSPLLAHNQDRAVRMPDDRIGNTSHKSAPYTADSSAPNDYKAGAQFLGLPDDLFVGFSYPEMNFRHGPSVSFDPPRLSIQQPLGLLVKLLLSGAGDGGDFRRSHTDVAPRQSHEDDVQL